MFKRRVTLAIIAMSYASVWCAAPLAQPAQKTTQAPKLARPTLAKPMTSPVAAKPAAPPAAVPHDISLPPLPPAPAVVAAAPAPAQELPEPAPDAHEKVMGIDTVDISEPRGNWLYKRIWWERAETLYEKIKQMVDQIYQARLIFFTRRTELDRNILDPFYLSVGLNQGELNQILSYYNQQVDRDRSANVTLDTKEREFLEMLVSEKKNLDGLQNSVQMVMKVDQAIDTALTKLIEQINMARNYEQQSWENFKAINRELSDKKAREYYYTMDTHWKNINNINSYIASQFTKYFDEAVGKIHQETENIKSQVKSLKEKGINITEQGQQLAHQGEVRIIQEKVKATEEEEEAQSKTFLQKITDFIMLPFNYISAGFSHLVSMVKGWFGRTEVEEEVVVEEEEPVPAPAAKSVPASQKAPAEPAKKTALVEAAPETIEVTLAETESAASEVVASNDQSETIASHEETDECAVIQV